MTNGRRIIRYSAAIVLTVAAVLKAVGLTRGDAGDFGPYSVAALVTVEALLAIWLLSGVQVAIAWWTAIALFSLFLLVTGFRVVQGAESCDCFGVIEVDPRITLILDAVILCALLMTIPERSAQPKPSRKRLALFAAPATVALALGPASLVMHHRAFTPHKDLLEGATLASLVVLDPEDWVEQSFPLASSLVWNGPPAELSKGVWQVVFFRHDCDKCARELPEWERRARADPAMRVVLIEIAPPKGQSIVSRQSACTLARLDPQRSWFVSTPTHLELRDGVVVSAKSH